VQAWQEPRTLVVSPSALALPLAGRTTARSSRTPFEVAHFVSHSLSLRDSTWFFLLVLRVSSTRTRIRSCGNDYDSEYHFIEYAYERNQECATSKRTPCPLIASLSAFPYLHPHMGYHILRTAALRRRSDAEQMLLAADEQSALADGWRCQNRFAQLILGHDRSCRVHGHHKGESLFADANQVPPIRHG
jgi:hypothetical protein